MSDLFGWGLIHIVEADKTLLVSLGGIVGDFRVVGKVLGTGLVDFLDDLHGGERYV